MYTCYWRIGCIHSREASSAGKPASRGHINGELLAKLGHQSRSICGPAEATTKGKLVDECDYCQTTSITSTRAQFFTGQRSNLFHLPALTVKKSNCWYPALDGFEPLGRNCMPNSSLCRRLSHCSLDSITSYIVLCVAQE